MLDGYYDLDSYRGQELIDAKKRLLAVQAALEIAKNSVGSPGASTISRVEQDLEHVTANIEALADAIQAALDK